MKTEPPLELLEQMAALMDGRLAEPERSRLLARMSESEELYQMLLEAGDLLGPEGATNGVGGEGVDRTEADPMGATSAASVLPSNPPEGAVSEGQPIEPSHGSQVAVDLPLRPRRRPLLWVLPALAAAALAALFLIQPQPPGRQLAWNLSNPSVPPVPFEWQEVRGEVEEGAVVRVGGRWFAANAFARAGVEASAYAELSALQGQLARSGMPSRAALVGILSRERSFDRNGPVNYVEKALRAMDPSAFDAGLRFFALRTAAQRGSRADVERLMGELLTDRSWVDSRMGPAFLNSLAESVAGGDLAAVASGAERALALLGSGG